MHTVVITIHVILAVALIGLILIQKPGEGALGGLGGSAVGSIFSRKAAGDFMTRLTTGIAICFMLTSIVLTILVRRDLAGDASILDKPAAAEEKSAAPSSNAEIPVAE